MSSGAKTPSSSALDKEMVQTGAEAEIDHKLVADDEFDALRIEIKPVQAPTTTPDPTPEERTRRAALSWLRDVGKYPAKQHALKAKKELGALSGLIYLPGLDEQFFEASDQGPPFRQRRHFFYLTGAGFPGCAVTYDIQRDYLILWIPVRDPRAVLYTGRTPSPDECKAASDLDDVRYIYELERYLYQTLAPGSTIYALRPDQAPKLERVRGSVHIDTSKLGPAIERARVIKTEHEIALIRRANFVSSVAHKGVMARLKRIHNECGVEGLFLGFCTSMGAKHQAYPVIAAAGRAASTLHYNDNDQPLRDAQLLVLDAGAEWNCYASDITRTIPVSGRFTKEAAAIYRIVERMQDECIRQVRPGILYYSLHMLACRIATEELLKLGILRGEASTIVAKGTIAAFFPHGLGHHLGLEVHDVAGRGRLLSAVTFSSVAAGRCSRVPPKRAIVLPEMIRAMHLEVLRATVPPERLPPQDRVLPQTLPWQKLEQNMVVTIEPGIYFCREYIESCFLRYPAHAMHINAEALDRYWDVGGVRIEDDILVTRDGYENLTVAPKGEEMLRIINGEGATGT